MITLWIDAFRKTEIMPYVLDSALFIVNEAMLSDAITLILRAHGTLTVSSDDGIDTAVPHMSLASIIGLSLLLAAFLMSLTTMTLYARSTVHWTKSPDAIAMMGLDAAAADELPLQSTYDANEVEALKRLPGWIGDAEPGAVVGRLGLGADAPLRPQRRVQGYPTESQDRRSTKAAWIKARTTRLRRKDGATTEDEQVDSGG